MDDVLANVSGWAREIYLVDSYSTDDTVELAMKHGATVVQRAFKGFGDQWNFAVHCLPVTSPWTMKLDPDERLTPELKAGIEAIILANTADAVVVRRRLWFLGRPLPISHNLVRLWRTGSCEFSDVTVNEHPMVNGVHETAEGELEHHDSPNLHHWWEKQNRYTTAEAIAALNQSSLSATPKLLGTRLQRRMWLKANFRRFPFRYAILFLYLLIFEGAWKAGFRGLIWSRLRAEVYRMIDLKLYEMNCGVIYDLPDVPQGKPDFRVRQCN